MSNQTMTTDVKVEELKQMATSIINDSEKYKEALELINNRNKFNKLSEDEKKKVQKHVNDYNNFTSSLADIVLSSGLNKEIVMYFLQSDGFANAIASTITFKTTQLRKLFHQVKQVGIEYKRTRKFEKVEPKLIQLYPLLAYSKGRGLINEYFYKLVKAMIDRILKSRNEEELSAFLDIFEAIVAYHRYHNPSN